MKSLTMLDVFDDVEQQELIESVVRHNLGTDNLVGIAKLSGELGDRGLSVERILAEIMDKVEKGIYQGIEIK